MIPIPLEEPTKKELQDKLMKMPELENEKNLEQLKSDIICREKSRKDLEKQLMKMPEL